MRNCDLMLLCYLKVKIRIDILKQQNKIYIQKNMFASYSV